MYKQVFTLMMFAFTAMAANSAYAVNKSAEGDPREIAGFASPQITPEELLRKFLSESRLEETPKSEELGPVKTELFNVFKEELVPVLKLVLLRMPNLKHEDFMWATRKMDNFQGSMNRLEVEGYEVLNSLELAREEKVTRLQKLTSQALGLLDEGRRFEAEVSNRLFPSPTDEVNEVIKTTFVTLFVCIVAGVLLWFTQTNPPKPLEKEDSA